VLGVIGPNGAGKTTLFECLARVLPFDHGTVTLNASIAGPSAGATPVFYVPDAIAPWPSQTVRWALEFSSGFFGGDADAIDEIVRRLDLGHLLDVPMGVLSKGQRKRAVLAVGLLTPHAVLLVDEPFDGLDLRQSREMAATLLDHAATGRTLMLSIHQISDAARVCSRFVLLSSGRVCGDGTLDELAVLAAGRGAAIPERNLEEVFLALT
jgi:ABC-2 type transport system ATP-binding protein